MGRVKERRDVYRTGVVRSLKRPNNYKGMLMIEDRIFTEQELLAIAVVSPGARVNSIRGGKVVQKQELSMPSRIEGLGACPNVNCITHPQHKESVSAIFFRVPGGLMVRCHFCDQVFTTTAFLRKYERTHSST